MPEKPEFELRLMLENGAAIRPHLAQVLKRLTRNYSIRVVKIVPANEAARELIIGPPATWREFRCTEAST